MAEFEIPPGTFPDRVYRAIARYCPDEAVCWPSQQLIADDLGCSREAVNRAVRVLIRAGWLVITERRRGRRGWLYNVYELLEPFAVSTVAMKRITRRAHARKPARCRHDHTNKRCWCRCRACREDKAVYRDGSERLPTPIEWCLVQLDRRLHPLRA